MLGDAVPARGRGQGGEGRSERLGAGLKLGGLGFIAGGGRATSVRPVGLPASLVEPFGHLDFELLDLRVHLVEALVHLLGEPGQALVQDDVPEGLPPFGVFLQDSDQVAYVVDLSHGRGSLFALRARRVRIIFLLPRWPVGPGFSPTLLPPRS